MIPDSRAQTFVLFGKGVQKVRGIFYGQLIKGLKQGADSFGAVFPVKGIVQEGTGFMNIRWPLIAIGAKGAGA